MTQPALPAGLEQAFLLAAGELGMCSAAWLVVEQLSTLGGEPLVDQAREQLGDRYPVLDHVCTRHLADHVGSDTDPAAAVQALAGVKNLVIVGVETRFLDRLLPQLQGVRVALLTDGALPADWDRVLANLHGEVEPVALGEVLRFAGRSSALLTFLYGVSGNRTHVVPPWLRVMGPDVRTSFRTLLGWNVLAAPMRLYPRWLAQVETDDAFSTVV